MVVFKTKSCAVIVAVVVAFFTVDPASPELRPSVEASAVRVSGLPPGAEAVLVGLERVWIGYGEGISRAEERATDEDRDGEVVFERAGGIAPTSVWIAIVPVTGEVAALAPAEAELRLLDPPPVAFDVGPDGSVTHARLEGGRTYELALVQSGTGVFRGSTGDGGPLDSDLEHDGSIVVDLSLLEGVRDGDEALLGPIGPADRLIGIDFSSLEAFVVEIGSIHTGGAR